jgi:serine/threonine protein kinase/tetratricopeptide (TPR) repeat protein
MKAMPRPPTAAGLSGDRGGRTDLRREEGTGRRPDAASAAGPDAAGSRWGVDSDAPLSSSSGAGSELQCRSWATGRERPSRLRPPSQPGWPAAGSSRAPDSRWEWPPVLDEFTAAWARGEAPAVEAYLRRLDPDDSEAAVELIYREYCLVEADGGQPDASSYLARFPGHREPLERLLRLHAACSPSLLGRWLEPAEDELPEAGDSIGPYRLRRELGRGSFARVFLAEQADLEDRLVVVKVSSRATSEPWLLARVRHAHIVEIVTYAQVNDGAFQLICMPFWGGATLAAVLAARRRRGRAGVSGVDLLADLDEVGAPEYPAVHPARPARAMLASLSYSQALAWIVARLAEALGHAFSREVAHGDVKPSNILLSADGIPMLLDFNLARDGAAGADGPAGPNDPGGTLAYMAPERLHRLGSLEPAGDRSPAAGRDAGGTDPAPHLADIYALGTVLLEALTGRPPATVEAPRAPGRQSRLACLRAAARAHGVARDRSARSLIRLSEAAACRTIAPGLRTILERCLDPDPACRYRRASELAEDLDRWRTDRPPAFTAEPFWGQALPRWVRRHRRALATTALATAVGLIVTFAAWLGSARVLHQTLEAVAMQKLARHWDGAEARTYRYQRPQAPRLLEPEDPRTVEAALRALNDYEVLGPLDWRRREDVRRLPAADRDDLELWILEQAYRYGRALVDRPDSPADWLRALDLLARAAGPTSIPAFDPIRHRLGARLGRGTAPAPSGSSARQAPAWLDRYLLGVVAECEPEPQDGSLAAGIPTPTPLGSADVARILDAQARARLRAAERALRHYRAVLEVRPDSFWGHYRAAVASYALDRPDDPHHVRIAEAAAHLEACLNRRPGNPVLSAQLAGCLMILQRFPDALQQCDRALDGAPELAEFYRSRAFIRTKLGQTGGLGGDLLHFELRSGLLPRASWDRDGARDVPGTGAHRFPTLGAIVDRETRLGGVALLSGTNPIGESPPEELDARVVLAGAILEAGAVELAEAELVKVLALDSRHLAARWAHAVQAVRARRFDEAWQDLAVVLNHADLPEHLRQDPSRLERLHLWAYSYLQAGRVEEARTIARQALDCAIDLKVPRGEAHLNLARVHAVAGRTDPRSLIGAAKQLFRAFAANPGNRSRYQLEPIFDPVRPQIEAELRRMPGPAEMRRGSSPVVPR